MRHHLRKFNRPIMVALLTTFAIVLTLPLAYMFYSLSGEPFRQIDLIIAISAPLMIAPICTWWLFGLLIRLDELEIKMRDLAFFDGLTQLMTRRAFFKNAELYFELARRHSKCFGLLMVDLDHFKTINDRYGHAFGDRVLQHFGNMVRNIKRKSDIVGRYGGEEFIFILPDTKQAGVLQYAQKLHTELAQMTFQHTQEVVKITTSIGAAFFAGSDEVADLKTLIEHADHALYQAKTSGRNITVLYQGELARQQMGP